MPESVVLDLDGTVYRGGDPVPGAADAVRRLRDAGLSVLFVSNNPSRSPATYVERLRSMGIPAEEREVLTAGTLTATYLRDYHPGADCYVVGTDDLRAQLRAAGVSVVEDSAAMDVLVGSWDDGFDYDTLVTVLRSVDPDTPFVGTDPDMTFPGSDGDLYPGTGAILHALSGVLDRKPDVIAGKPSERAVGAILDRLNVPAEEVLVVGDRLETDVRMGQRADMETALVLSGVTDRADLTDATVEPDHVLPDLSAVDRLLESSRV